MTNKERYALKKANGICTKCRNKAVEGKTLCQYHIDYNARERKAYIEMNICPYCHSERLYGNERACYNCLEKQRIRSKANYDNNIEKERKRLRDKGRKITAERKTKGVCTRCGGYRDDKRFAMCFKCRERSRIKNYGKVVV